MSFYKGKDPRELPLYRLSEVGHYLAIPDATVRAWFLGQSGRHAFKAVLPPADSETPRLSFHNVVEAHVIDALRKKHRISLQKLRQAIRFFKEKLPSPHPLLDNHFATDGLDLFVEKYGSLICVSREGQLGIRQVLEAYLRRIDRDEKGMPIRLFPYTRRKEVNTPRLVVIDPRIAFGRPVLQTSGIPTAVIAQRYKAGESILELVRDYEAPQEEIEEAIRLELAA